MSDLTRHYQALLGLDESWAVRQVDFSLEEKKVEIGLEHLGGPLSCPECGASCPQADLAPERQWRHLDTMQFQTVLRARAPRAKCAACGVKTIALPWASKHSRFTVLFEAFAIEVLKACSNVQRAAALLGLDWQTTHGILERAVERGLERRQLDEVRRVGIDEKSFGAGQSYVSLMTDLEGSRVLEVVEDRTKAAADELWQTLTPPQRDQVLAVAVDMWEPYMASAAQQAPQAEIVHDKFHVAQHLNEAVDKVRRQENWALRAEGDDRLAGSKHLWLSRPDTLTEERHDWLAELRDANLKTSRAWAIKEHFRRFWDYIYTSTAEQFFYDWHSWAVRSRLTPIIETAKMLKRHLSGLLSYFRQRVTNAVSEGFNSRIQSIKSAARGFRAFANYRLRILFYCRKLDLQP
jgi:transposase